MQIWHYANEESKDWILTCHVILLVGEFKNLDLCWSELNFEIGFIESYHYLQIYLQLC